MTPMSVSRRADPHVQRQEFAEDRFEDREAEVTQSSQRESTNSVADV